MHADALLEGFFSVQLARLIKSRQFLPERERDFHGRAGRGIERIRLKLPGRSKGGARLIFEMTPARTDQVRGYQQIIIERLGRFFGARVFQ